MNVKQLLESESAKETEELALLLPLYQFAHYKSHMPRPGIEFSCRGKPATNRLGYGMA
jgi:hypothetical protein